LNKHQIFRNGYRSDSQRISTCTCSSLQLLIKAKDAQNAALANKEGLNGAHGSGFAASDQAAAQRAAGWGPYGGNPLAHVATNDSEMRMAAFGGAFQPGLYRAPKKDFANPAPLGLSAFALTTFVLSLINMRAKNVTEPNLVVAAAYGYGGLVQLLAGMCK
jgi:hypothetical protein